MAFWEGHILLFWHGFYSSYQVEEEWESELSYSVGLEAERAAQEEQLIHDTTEEDKPEKVPGGGRLHSNVFILFKWVIYLGWLIPIIWSSIEI